MRVKVERINRICCCCCDQLRLDRGIMGRGIESESRSKWELMSQVAGKGTLSKIVIKVKIILDFERVGGLRFL